MDRKDFFKYDNKKNFVKFEGLWKLEDNIVGVEKIIKFLLSDENSLGKISYYEKGRYKKIDKFDYEKDVRSDDRNELIFFGEGKEGMLFKISMDLADIYVGKGEKKRLYSCNKSLNLEIFNKEIDDKILVDYIQSITKDFNVIYFRSSGVYIDVRRKQDIQDEYCPAKRYPMTDILDPISFIGPFIFKDILNKEEFIKQITPLVYKLEETEEGGMYVQVNEHDAFNITTKENEHNYIEYLKVLNELLPYSAFQSLYYAKEIIDKYGGLKGWWRLISYIEKWGEEGMGDIKKLIPEVLNEEGKLNITDEDFKLLMGTPQANYQYLNSNTMQIEKKKFTKE